MDTTCNEERLYSQFHKLAADLSSVYNERCGCEDANQEALVFQWWNQHRRLIPGQWAKQLRHIIFKKKKKKNDNT